MNQLLIVASSAIARAGLTALLAEQTQNWAITSVATLKDWEENTSPPLDALLLDLTEPEAESLAAVLALGETNLAPIVVLLAQNAEWPIPDLLQSGVQGVLPSDATVPEILAALEAALAGLITLHPSFMEDLSSALPSPLAALASQLEPLLTPRETEILNLITQGASNKTIAQTLFISEHTVKFHLSAIFAKLGVSTRTEAALAGARLGIVLL